MSSKAGRTVAGLVLFAVFLVVLVLMFMPLFRGRNALRYLDDLYNSISKGSAYYIPSVTKEARALEGRSVSVRLMMEDEDHAEQTALLYRKSGAEVSTSGEAVIVTGDLGAILANCIADADVMYNNRGDEIKEKYGYDERQVLFNWWKSLKELDKDLGKQKNFKEAKLVSMVNSKAVETSYNYYQIDPQKITGRVGVVIFSLAFYVVYTLWYGFAIMYLFEGWGLKLTH